jgi:hypothetical protein
MMPASWEIDTRSALDARRAQGKTAKILERAAATMLT